MATALGTGRVLWPLHHSDIHGTYLTYGCVLVTVIGTVSMWFDSVARAAIGDGDVSLTGGNYSTYVSWCNANTMTSSPNNCTHGSIKG